MKIEKIKVPTIPEYVEAPRPSSEDVSYMENLAKQGKIKELEDYVNDKTLKRALSSSSSSIPPRDYFASALDQLVKKRYPELDTMEKEKQVEFLKQRVYPGLSDVTKAFNLSNKVNINEGEDEYDPATGIINLNKYGKEFIDSALHELAHSVDYPIQKYQKNIKTLSGSEKDRETQASALSEFIKKNPKIKKIQEFENKGTTESEGSGGSLIRSPNFEDYNWRTGEFGSDIIQNPIDKYKEVGGEHHINRPFSLENFINFSKGDLQDIVKSEPTPSRFQKIKKIMV